MTADESSQVRRAYPIQVGPASPQRARWYKALTIVFAILSIAIALFAWYQIHVDVMIGLSDSGGRAGGGDLHEVYHADYAEAHLRLIFSAFCACASCAGIIIATIGLGLSKWRSISSILAIGLNVLVVIYFVRVLLA